MSKDTLIRLTAIFAVIVALTSCSNKLPEQLNGTWQTAAQPVPVGDDAEGLISITLDLKKDAGKDGGTVVESFDFSMNGEISDGLMMTADFSGKAYGQWIVDNDEMELEIDSETLEITLDENSVSLTAEGIDEATQAALDSMLPELVSVLKEQISNQIVEDDLSGFITDIKMDATGNSFTCMSDNNRLKFIRK